MPVFAEVSDTVAVLGAVGTFITVVLGALAGWWLKIKQQTANTAMQARKVETAEERRQRRDEINELYKIITLKQKDHEDNRTLIHELRDQMGVLSNDFNAAKMELAVCRQEREELKRDRDELTRRVDALEHRAGE